MQVVVGIDIGGTKCAISFAKLQDETIVFLDKVRMETKKDDFEQAVEEFIASIQSRFRQNPEWELMSIGISCGGPLDSQKGVILGPPNLPEWNPADIFTPLKKAFGVPVMIQNDADACALAEWSLGAGKGCRNMIFLTFGTGMGAGMILNGELYTGTTNMAGEVGHMRLAPDGPMGYGKAGSFEGFCSGGGIADLGRRKAEQAIKEGRPPLFCREKSELESVSSKKIAEALEQGDELAAEIFDTVGSYLGKGLAVLIDILNPEMIVIGSIYARQKAVLDRTMKKALEEEALDVSRKSCRIVPAMLGEMIGDYAAVSVGIKAYKDLYRSV